MNLVIQETNWHGCWKDSRSCRGYGSCCARFLECLSWLRGFAGGEEVWHGMRNGATTRPTGIQQR